MGAWVLINDRWYNGAGYEIWTDKQRLVLTNTGSHDRMKPGFLYCPMCGRAEPNGWGAGRFQQGGHPRPNPDNHPHGASCNGTPTVVVLGNEFETDIALFRFQLAGTVILPPGSVVARIVLTTVAEALASAAAKILDIEESDIGAEFRVAMRTDGLRVQLTFPAPSQLRAAMDILGRPSGAWAWDVSPDGPDLWRLLT